MGRGKIEIKKIENTSARHVSFSKRRQGLFKKARELAILCDADVAVIIFSSSGRAYAYSNSDMKKILSRFNDCVETGQGRAVEHEPEKQGPNEVDVLNQEIENLKSKQGQLLDKDLINMDLKELDALDKQLHEGLICVKTRKEQILTQEIEQSRMRKQQMTQENQILQRQVEEIQRLFPPINYLAPFSTNYTRKTTSSVKEVDYRNSDTVLLLGASIFEN
ncbi:hypothetical protein OROGR_030295 [Orobanche gracilis]